MRSIRDNAQIPAVYLSPTAAIVAFVLVLTTYLPVNSAKRVNFL